MSLTIKDINNAIMEARVKVNSWGTEANNAFFQPESKAVVGKLWAKTDPAMKQMIKEFNPQLYQQYVDMFGE